MGQRGRGDERPSIEERVEELQRVVSLLVYKMDKDFDVTLDFSPRSISYLDAVLAESRRKGGTLAPGLYLSAGGYIGETLVRNYGGDWTDIDGQLCIELEGEAHRRFLRVFDWVHQAYEDPRTKSLTYRMQALGGIGGWDRASDAASA